MEEKIAEIIRKINTLRDLDKDFKTFGSSSHEYAFNEKLSEVELEHFEKKYDIILPDGYRLFLKLIGNGGAGPFYGINKLENSIPEYYTYDSVCFKNDFLLLKDEFKHKEAWNINPKILNMIDLYSGFPSDFNLKEYYFQKYLNTTEWEVLPEEWEIIKLFGGNTVFSQNVDSDVIDFFNNSFYNYYYSRSTTQGSLEICEYGCALKFLLVVSGAERSNIWFDERVDRGGITPEKNKNGEHINFTDWYLNWLDESIEELS